MPAIYVALAVHRYGLCQMSSGAFCCMWNCVRRGSPLVVGVKSHAKFATDHFPVVYSKGNLIYLWL